MWTEMETMRAKLAAADDSEKLEFFIYYDEASGVYRKFKQVRPVSLQLLVGDSSRVVFGYQLALVAEDPAIYSTAQGS